MNGKVGLEGIFISAIVRGGTNWLHGLAKLPRLKTLSTIWELFRASLACSQKTKRELNWAFTDKIFKTKVHRYCKLI